MLESFAIRSQPNRYKVHSRSPQKKSVISPQRNQINLRTPENKGRSNITKSFDKDIEQIIQKYIKKSESKQSNKFISPDNKNRTILSSISYKSNHKDGLYKSQECGLLKSYIENYTKASHISDSNGKQKNKTLSIVHQKALPTQNVLKEKSSENSVKSSVKSTLIQNQSVKLDEIFQKIDNQEFSAGIYQKSLPFPVKYISSRQSAERETVNSKNGSRIRLDQENEISKEKMSGESFYDNKKSQSEKSPFEKLLVNYQQNQDENKQNYNLQEIENHFQIKSQQIEQEQSLIKEIEKSLDDVEFGNLSPLVGDKKEEHSKSFEKLEDTLTQKEIDQKQRKNYESMLNQQFKIDEMLDQAFVTSQSELKTEPVDNQNLNESYPKEILEQIVCFDDRISDLKPIVIENQQQIEKIEERRPIIQPINLTNQLSTIDEEEEIRNLQSSQQDNGENSNPLLEKLNSMISEINFKLDGTSKLSTQQHVKLLDIQKKYAPKIEKDNEIFQDLDDQITDFEEEQKFYDKEKITPEENLKEQNIYDLPKEVSQEEKTDKTKLINMNGKQSQKQRILLNRQQVKNLNLLLRLFFLIIISLQLKDLLF